MNPEIKALWITALRSGEYEQARRQLRVEFEDRVYGYCCLGVLTDLAVKAGVINWNNNSCGSTDCTSCEDSNPRQAYLRDNVREWAGLDIGDPYLGADKASVWNDEGESFLKIAELIEQYL